MNQQVSRKTASEKRLASIKAPTNEHLPLIEADEEVSLRTDSEVLQRLIALWAVAGHAFLRGNPFFRDYITALGYESWLSDEEKAFLLSPAPTERQYIRFSWQLESLHFLGWCAGLLNDIQIPLHESSVDSILHLFPKELEPPNELQRAIRIRSKAEILDWSDLLYRLHWAVRDVGLQGKSASFVSGGAVQEWHRAVNWMTNYGQEENWDEVGTDT